MSEDEIRGLLALARKGDADAEKVLLDRYEEIPHGPACARRVVGSAECDCYKDEIMNMGDSLPENGYEGFPINTAGSDCEYTITDAGDTPGELTVRVHANRIGVEIRADGYGDCGTEPGHGSPVFLELYEGKLRLIVWADINQEDPTHVIDLGGALESNRKPEPE